MWLLSLFALRTIPNRLERMAADADLQASSPLIVSLSIRCKANGLSTLKNVSENKGLKFFSKFAMITLAR